MDKRFCWRNFVFTDFPKLVVTSKMVYCKFNKRVAVKGLATNKALEERRERALKSLQRERLITGMDGLGNSANEYIVKPDTRTAEAFIAGICLLIGLIIIAAAVIVTVKPIF